MAVHGCHRMYSARHNQCWQTRPGWSAALAGSLIPTSRSLTLTCTPISWTPQCLPVHWLCWEQHMRPSGDAACPLDKHLPSAISMCPSQSLQGSNWLHHDLPAMANAAAPVILQQHVCWQQRHVRYQARAGSDAGPARLTQAPFIETLASSVLHTFHLVLS